MDYELRERCIDMAEKKIQCTNNFKDIHYDTRTCILARDGMNILNLDTSQTAVDIITTIISYEIYCTNAYYSMKQQKKDSIS